MKRLRGLFGNPLSLLIILVLVFATMLLVSGRALPGFGGGTTPATATQDATAIQKGKVVVFQTPPASPTPTPTLAFSPGIESLKVIATDPVENGPYENIVWSPDGKKALVTKQRTPYILARDRNVLVEKFPSRVIPSTTIDLGDLWLLDLASGEERQLLQQVRHYIWSPDSTQVAYIAPTEAEGVGRALYVLDIASGESRRVVEVDYLGSEYPPQWLPSGEIVYVRDGQLRSINANERVEKTLPGFKSFGRVTIEAGQMVYLTGPDAPLGFHFSPDGKRVAYKTYPNERAITYRLWLADADGSAAKLITEQAEGGYYEWSPNSEWLVFNTFRDVDDPTVDEHDPGLQGLWAVRADGSDVHPLYRTVGWRSILSPTWSPDSAMVIFIQSQYVAEYKEERDLWVTSAAEKETASLLLPGSNEAGRMIRDVWWSPDGHYLFTLSEAPGRGMPRQYWYQSNRLTLTTK